MADESLIPLKTEIRYREKGEDDESWVIVGTLVTPSDDGRFYFNLSVPDTDADYEAEIRFHSTEYDVFSDWMPAQIVEDE